MEFPYVSAANSCDIQRSFHLLRPGKGGGCVIDNILCINAVAAAAVFFFFPWKQNVSGSDLSTQSFSYTSHAFLSALKYELFYRQFWAGIEVKQQKKKRKKIDISRENTQVK